MKKNVIIIDYKMSNIFSIKNICNHLSVDSKVTSDYKDIIDADVLILPGVGAFSEAMKNLGDLEMIDPIKKFINSGKPFMGVCLGLQLLFTKSYEFGTHLGLDIIPGEVIKFPSQNNAGNNIRVPHVGWNHIKPSKSYENTPLKNINNNEYMYFIHSYFVKPEHKVDVLSTTEYSGIEFCSSIIKDNIFATQFHPERSGVPGVQLFKKWLELVN